MCFASIWPSAGRPTSSRWPTKGSNELITALVSGEIQMTWTALGSWADNPNDAKGRILALDGAKRSPKLPDVPTYPEAGLGDYPIHTWMALFAPADVPDAIIAQVNSAVGDAIKTPEVDRIPDRSADRADGDEPAGVRRLCGSRARGDRRAAAQVQHSEDSVEHFPEKACPALDAGGRRFSAENAKRQIYGTFSNIKRWRAGFPVIGLMISAEIINRLPLSSKVRT